MEFIKNLGIVICFIAVLAMLVQYFNLFWLRDYKDLFILCLAGILIALGGDRL